MTPKKKSSTKKTKRSSQNYLHGYEPSEQNRLYRQARIFEPLIFENLPFSNVQSLIEVGCGVGAQSEILLEHFPNLSITGVDASTAQLNAAKKHLSKKGHNKRVKLLKANASHLPFSDDSFDGAFLCWFLEHVTDPVGVLEEARRVMKLGSNIVCNETFNASFYLHPYSPATLKYWFEFNDLQWSLKGDPFAGGKLANYLIKAGFQNIETKVLTSHYDNRRPKARAEFIAFWTDLLLSGSQQLLSAKRIDQTLIQEMKAEMDRLKKDPESVIFYSWVQATAQAL